MKIPFFGIKHFVFTVGEDIRKWQTNLKNCALLVQNYGHKLSINFLLCLNHFLLHHEYEQCYSKLNYLPFRINTLHLAWGNMSKYPKQI